MSFKKIKLPLLILSAFISIITGWMMWSKWQAEELWGYLPLWFFLGVWGTIVLLVSIRSKTANKHRILGLSTLSGLLLSLGFPPIPLTTLLFVGFVPLLLIEQSIADTHPDRSARKVFWYAYSAFVFWNIGTTYWVANTAFFAGIFAIWVNSLFMSIPFVLFHVVKKRMPNVGMVAFVSFWLTFEYFHLDHELSWPWLTLGNGLAQFPSWAQWYEYTGVFGGSLWILTANTMFYKVIANYYFHRVGISLKSLWKPLAFLVVPLIISFSIYFTYEEQGVDSEMVVVQPNYEPHYGKDEVSETTRFNRHLDLSLGAISPNTEYLIFPESSFDRLDEGQLNNNQMLRKFRTALEDYPNLKVIFGSGAYRFFSASEADRPAIREGTSRNGEPFYYEAYNAAFQFSIVGNEVQVYHKSKLVPGAEFFPLKNVLPFMKPLVDKLGGSVAGFGKQAEREVFGSTNGFDMAPIICYESVYGEYVLGYVRNGADALVIITNDGWWDETAGHRQHLLFAGLRAIETRRSIARSANTGISGFINQRGEVISATKYNEATALNDTIKLNKVATLYARYGDLIGRVSIFLTAILLLNLIAKVWQARVERTKKA
jgi:apolipoprotein N-acyltransferase